MRSKFITYKKKLLNEKLWFRIGEPMLIQMPENKNEELLAIGDWKKTNDLGLFVTSQGSAVPL